MLRAEQDVEVLQSGKAVEQKSQDYLAQETISPGQKDLMLFENLTDHYHG